MTNSKVELKKLYNMLEKVSDLSLGADYQARMDLKKIRKTIIEKIKNIESNNKPQQVVEYNHG